VAERVLITGAAGFVGRHLAKYLMEQSLEVHGLDRPDVRQPIEWQGPWYATDVTDAKHVTSVLLEAAPDYVFHLAALVKSDSLADLLVANVVGSQNVLSAVVAVRPGARVLVAGSSAEYGLARPNELPIREENPLRPISPYGVSKAAQSLLAAQYAYRYGLHVLRTRTFNLTGPGESDMLVCSAFARQIVEIELGQRPPVLQVGNLESGRDFTDIRDAVRAYWLIAKYGKAGEVYNVCSGAPVLIREVLRILICKATERVEIQEDAKRYVAGDVPLQYGDATKLRHATEWSPIFTLQESLQDLIEFWRGQLS
jgi:GDP-4-dehydro-6-deoxy-D-mannose reductase